MEEQQDTQESSVIDQTSSTTSTASNSLLIPGAIVVAGLLIAGAVVYSAGNSGTPVGAAQAGAEPTFGNHNSRTAENVRPVDETDHVYGNPEATVAIIEFSDFECPFCARFHPTAKQIVDDSGGTVKWVYRHFPLTSIHPNAAPAALASECIAHVGSNDAFWSFTDAIFEGNLSLRQSSYETFVTEQGLDLDRFRTCMEETQFADAVTADLSDAVNAGGTGTPYNIVINSAGEVFPFSGALPYENVKAIVDAALGV